MSEVRLSNSKSIPIKRRLGVGEPHRHYCDHDWDSGRYLRVCLKCGQLRTFPGREVEEEPKVLWPGRGAEGDPQLPLSKQQESAIAHLAEEMGIKKLEKVSGVPVTLLHSWVEAYCRTGKTELMAR